MSAENPRLLFRVDPLPLESPRGYLSRVAHEHGYPGPLSIARIAGLQRTNLERNEDAERIAHVLRLEPEEWRAMCYRRVRDKGRYFLRSFCGHSITADALNYGRTRVCPDCLRERPVCWAVWDLGARLGLFATSLLPHRSVPRMRKAPSLAASFNVPVPLWS